MSEQPYTHTHTRLENDEVEDGDEEEKAGKATKKRDQRKKI